MTLSMYQASGAALHQHAEQSFRILARQKHMPRHEKSIPRIAFLTAFPDMFPLARQIQIACDNPRGPSQGCQAWKCQARRQ